MAFVLFAIFNTLETSRLKVSSYQMITKNGHLIDKVVQNSCYKKVVNFAHSKYNHECMQHRASCVHNGKKSAATGNNNNKKISCVKKDSLMALWLFPFFFNR